MINPQIWRPRTIVGLLGSISLIAIAVMISSAERPVDVEERAGGQWRDRLVDIGEGYRLYDVEREGMHANDPRRRRFFLKQFGDQELQAGTRTYRRNGEVPVVLDMIMFGEAGIYTDQRVGEVRTTTYFPSDHVYLEVIEKPFEDGTTETRWLVRRRLGHETIAEFLRGPEGLEPVNAAALLNQAQETG